jgi:hypothetical protein
MSKNTENAKLLALFIRTDDNRAKLFVDVLRNQWDDSMTGVKITRFTPEFRSQYFKDNTQSDDEMHQEWIEFGNDIGTRLGDKNLTSTELADALKIVTANAGNASGDPEKQFTQQLIKTLFAEMKDSSTDQKNVTTQWQNVKTLKYNPRTNLANMFDSTNTELKKVHDAIKSGTGGDKAREFKYRYDKFWLRSLLEAHVASATQSVGPSSFWNDDVKPTGQTYYRKGSELYMRDASGKEVRVDVGSPAFQSLKTEDKCLGTGFIEGSGSNEKCADYLRDCLSGKNVMKCKNFLDRDDFWPDAQKEVDAMLPAMAVQTLNAFEFGMEQVWDNTANRRLLKYKSTDAWIANLVDLTKKYSSGMSADDVKKIANNGKLIGYLKMLVHKVNSNPSILNSDYTGGTDNLRINDPDAFAGSRLHRMGVKARLAVPTLSVSSVDKLANGIRDSNSKLSFTLGIHGVQGYGPRFTLMSGGGIVEDLETKVSDSTKRTSFIIESHFVALTGRLQKFNKTIEKSDSDKINELIKSLKEAEEKLYKASLYTEKYAKLLEIHGEKDATSVLSMDHLKQFVESRNKYFSRVAKKQNDLLSILRSIAEAANKEAPSTEAELKALSVDPKSINFGALLG